MSAPTADAAARSRFALPVILASITINMIGVGLAWPILPKLVQQMGTGSVAQAAAAYAIIGIVFALSQFLFSPLTGNLADRFGRRPVMLVCLAGLGVDYVLTGLAPNLVALGIIRFAGGMFAAIITTGNAAAADISTPENRAHNFGLIGASFGVGFILGPLMGGWLGAIDVRLPFYAAGALAAINVLAAWFFLPETLPPHERRPFVLSESNPLKTLGRIAPFPRLLPLLIALLITATAQRGLEATWVLYTEFRFGWDIRAAAWSLAFVGVMYFIVQGFLVGPAVRRIGEWRTMLVGFAVSGVSLAAYSWAEQGWMAYPLIAGYALGNGIGAPALNAICSRTVAADRQGQLQGALQSVNAIAVIVGPFAASLVLAHVAAPDPLVNLPGAWFALGAAVFAIAFALALMAQRRLPAAP